MHGGIPCSIWNLGDSLKPLARMLARQICFKDRGHFPPDFASCPLLLAVHPSLDWTASADLSERSLCPSQARAPTGRAAEAGGHLEALADTSGGLLGHLFPVPVVCL